VFNYNLTFTYGLIGDGHTDHSHDELTSNLVFEINGEWRDQMQINGVNGSNSGGNVIYFSPGITLSKAVWSLSVSYGRAMTNLKGLQSKPEDRMIVQFGRSF